MVPQLHLASPPRHGLVAQLSQAVDIFFLVQCPRLCHTELAFVHLVFAGLDECRTALAQQHALAVLEGDEPRGLVDADGKAAMGVDMDGLFVTMGVDVGCELVKHHRVAFGCGDLPLRETAHLHDVVVKKLQLHGNAADGVADNREFLGHVGLDTASKQYQQPHECHS